MKAEQSLDIAHSTIQYIIRQANETVRLKKLVKEKMALYSSIRVFKFINEPLDTLEMDKPVPQTTANQQKQPKALLTDCLLPISAEVYNQNQYQKRVAQYNKQKAKMAELNNSSVVIDQQQNQSPFVQLNVAEFEKQYVSDDGPILQMRKWKQEAQKKRQADQKKRRQMQQNEAKQANKKKQKGKQQKISFDFNGNIIKVKNEPKSNLISQLLKPRTSKQALKAKQINKKPEAMQIQVKSPRKNDGKKVRKLQEIQFSQVKSLLQDLAISKGSKMKQDKVMVQDKKKRMSLAQIKQSLTTSRISRLDYQRLREATGPTENREMSITSKQDVSKLQQETGLKRRSQSEANLTRNLKGTITVSNENLRDLYLTKALPTHYEVPEIQKSRTQLQHEEQAKRPQMDDNDRYNLGYIKGNTNKKASQSSRSLSHILKLPRLSVHSKNADSNEVIAPKNRQKLKQGTTIRRQLRKKFEDKLRI